MEADDRYLLGERPQPEQTQLAQHPNEQRRANLALLIALIAACFTAWQVWESHEARIDAKIASDKQTADVERSMRAAEASATAAQNLVVTESRAARASEHAAYAAARSAKSSEQSLILTRKEIMLSNQPFLDIIDNKILHLVTPNVMPSVMTRIYNGGKGLARGFSAKEWMNIAPQFVFEEGLNPEETLSLVDMPPGRSSMVTMMTAWPMPLTVEQSNDINAGLLKLYIYGIAKYSDDILDQPRHYTWRWCYWYDPNRPRPDAMLLTACPEHNNTSIN
jgi:hypothetical protein